MTTNLLWLAPALILLMAIAANHADMRESWELGGPGERHGPDIEPGLRAAWDRTCLTCWMRGQ